MTDPWEKLPSHMQIEEVFPYHQILWEKRWSLRLKRLLDILLSLILLVLLLPLLLIIALAIKMDSPGPVFFRQERVTQYGKKFRIFKFRTMVQNAESLGSTVTIKDDVRVTRIGYFLRKYRLDEIPQLLDILRGTMTFVGTRPEATKYVREYTPEMMSTLLLPAGVTSTASIAYRKEQEILNASSNVDQTYIELILPEKMKFNLSDIQQYSLFHEMKILYRTVIAVFFCKN